MRKHYNGVKESFSVFSASLVAGDTAILEHEANLARVGDLLQKGVVVRTPQNEALEVQLRSDADLVGALAHIAGVLDRRARIGLHTPAKKPKRKKVSLEAKVHCLIEEQGWAVVEACRKVHCRPSDYYIYRSKLKPESYGR